MKLHHIGYVVKDIQQFENNLLVSKKVNELDDPVQNSRLALYQGFGDYYIELIQPLNLESYTWNFSKKNPDSFHHLCYTVKNIETVRKLTASKRMIHVLGPVPALLFNGNHVVFYIDRNKNLVEFLIENK